MKLRVLTDNHTCINQYYLGEPGVCYYIEDGGRRLLFDTGYSDVFLKNAEKMGLDLGSVDFLVFSHAHNDHTGGLPFFWEKYPQSNVHIVAHPTVFDPRRREQEPIGAPMTQESLPKHCHTVLSAGPLRLTDRLIYLGEIPRRFEFEQGISLGERRTADGWVRDELPDDTALVWQGEEGLFVITGCSHSGICNIVDYARTLCGERRIAGILGGLHLMQLDARAERTMEWLAEAGVQQLYPCHCTAFPVRAALAARLPVQEVGVGMEWEWN